MKTYKFVYRDAQGNDKKAFVEIEEDATIEENLVRIVPKAVERGILHSDADAQNVLVELNGVRLNPKVTFPKAAPDMKDEDYIVVRYLASSINLRLNFWADDPDDIRKVYFGRRRTQNLSEPVAVSPSEPLGPQVEEKLNEIKGKYKFFGTEVKDAARFALKAKGKKLLPALSLAEQGIESDADVKVNPRIWFDWPPAFYNGIRGPYTGFAITLALLVGVFALFFWIFGSEDVQYFRVAFQAPFECNVKIDDSAEWIHVVEGETADSILAGVHTIYIYERERPMRTQQVNMRRAVRGGVGDSDRLWTETLRASPENAATGKPTPVKVIGYQGEVDFDNLMVPVSLNGFEYSFDAVLGCDFNLMPGEYEIKFELSDDRHISSETSSASVVKKSDFVFVVQDTTMATVTFRYRREGDS